MLAKKKRHSTPPAPIQPPPQKRIVRMPMLTVWEPWASAIAFGPKRVENRHWQPPERYIGGDLLIHAGQSTRGMDNLILMAEVQQLWPGLREVTLRPGYALAVATLDRCVSIEHLEGDVRGLLLRNRQLINWACGPFCWLLSNVRPLAQPTPIRGGQGLPTVEVEYRRLSEYDAWLPHRTC